MLNSRDISLLRPDVAANCRKLIELAAKEGWPVLVTGTVRDEEYQLYVYHKGTSRSKVPTFHSVEAGLAFDICKNVKGEEYSDPEFWKAVSAMGKAMGFEWGGDWKSIVDMPHFQWSGPNHEYSSGDILAGNYPPEMPLYEEEGNMSYQQFLEYTARYEAERQSLPDADWGSEWQQAREWAEETGLLRGDGTGKKMYQALTTRQQLILLLYRLKDLM